MRKLAIALQAAALVSACAMPSTVVRTPESRPSLAVAGAPAGTFLFVDGKNAGPASAYEAQPASGPPRTLLVEPGTHDVEIRDGAGAVVYRQKVFVESELKTIQVH